MTDKATSFSRDLLGTRLAVRQVIRSLLLNSDDKQEGGWFQATARDKIVETTGHLYDGVIGLQVLEILLFS